MATPGSLYAVTLTVKDPAQLKAQTTFQVSIADSQGVVAEKWLHTEDLDFYLTLHPRSQGNVTATLHPATGEMLPEVTAAFHRVSETHSGPGVIAALPAGTWQTAQPIEFGQTVFGAYR